MSENNVQWATVDLMGHAQTAGRITMENGLVRVDVPLDGENFRTEYYGMAAIYSIKIVSEEIARAYVPVVIDARPYDAPIITREQHENDMNRARREMEILSHQVRMLERRLTAVNALPEHTRFGLDHQDDEDDEDWPDIDPDPELDGDEDLPDHDEEF